MVGPMVQSHFKRGWAIFRGIQTRINEANLTLVAAGGAFFAMLSIFPGLAAVITLTGFVVEPTMVEDQLLLLEEFIPPEAFAILKDQIERMILTSNSTLGWAAFLGILAALWSARKGTDALIRGINAIYGGPARGGISNLALSFALTLMLSLMVIVALLSMVVVPLISTILNHPIFADILPPELLAWLNGFVLLALRWLIAGAMVFTGIWLLYRFAPNVTRKLTGFFSPGCLLAVAVWIVATLSFNYFLGNFANYSQIYGSIGAVVALLMFLYLTIFTVLLGAALNAELEPVLAAQEETPTPQTGPTLQSDPAPLVAAAATVDPALRP